MARVRTALWWGGAAFAGLLVLVAGLVFFLNRTERGQRIVLDYVLGQIESTLDGTITVEGIRSRGLLRGATLYGISVRGLDERPFLEVDSARATYDWRTFLGGDVILSSLDLWGPRLTISRYPGEESFNADRILRAEQDQPAAASTREVRFDDVRLVDAFVEILQPVDPDDPPPARAITTTLPGVEEPFHRIYFEQIQAWLPEAIVASPERAGAEVRVDSLSMVGFVYEDPFLLTQLEGIVTWAEGRLTVVADDVALPDTRASGLIVADFTPEGRGGRDTGWSVVLQLESGGYSLADLRWLLPDLPDGRGEGRFHIHLTDLGEISLGFSDATLVMNGSRLEGDGTILIDGETTFRDVRLRADPLALASLEAFTGALPLRGTVQGRVVLDGTLARLRAQGVVTLREPGYAPTTADFSGTFHLTDRRGVTDLIADLAPLDYRLLSVFVPASTIAGTGRARVRATGTLAEGVRYEADLVHEPGSGLPVSELQARGTLRGVGQAFDVDIDADVSPLSLTALRTYFPQLPLSGEVSGSIRASGPLSDLRVTTDLQTEAGRLAVEARFDARDPGAFYSVEGELGSFVLSRIVPELPDPTVFTGYLRLEGRGTDLRTASIDAVVRARDSRVWELAVDTADVAVRVRGGVFEVDAAYALVSGVELRASGSLAAWEGGAPGRIRVIFAADSLDGLRSALARRDILVRDGLTELERSALRAQGIDPDTLPAAAEVEVRGRVDGDVTLTGSLQRFSAEGAVSLEEVRYGSHFFRDADVAFTAEGLPDFGEAMRAHVVADSLELFGRGFRSADVTIDFARPAGTAAIHLQRNENEDYRTFARFELDSLGGRVELETLTLDMDTLSWELERPAFVSWDAEAVRVADLILVQAGEDGIRIEAAGVLPREGEADFALDVRGLELEQVTHLLQQEDLDLAGRVALDLRVRGTADQPTVVGSVEAFEVRYQGYSIERLEGDVEYLDRRFAVDVEAWENDLRVLRATGTIPAVLSLRDPGISFPDEEIDLLVVADSLPAVFVTGLFEQLEDVEGTVAGTFDIGGTLDNPAPSGSLTLQNAAWTIEAIGVRHENIQGTLLLRRDGTMEVDATARADGIARMTGSVSLTPLSNPTFDLAVSFNNFRAVDRRDAEGNVSGIVRLTGTFDRPLIQGLGPAEGLRVESGVLYLEEFARAATVIDLTDPRFAEFFNLSMLETRIVEESRNPFMQNLRVNVDLAVEQDTWLRSTEMNVEIAGNLRVTYDRLATDLVLTGVLDARRGSYTVLGRRFDVREGRVEFVGIPGIDPNLDIRAQTRVRQPNTEHLDITARVTGTLTQPRVELGSDAAAIGQSDLVSYLLFGRPSYELASGEQAALRGAAGSFVGTVFSGTVASRLGTVLAQQWGLDYFAITELGNVGFDLGSVTQTQVEFGRYLSQDLFLVMAFQPTQLVGPNPFNTFGVRLEYTPTDRYTLEASWEDRFLRNRALGFQDAAFRSQKILGLLVFTEWGY
jgi:hypothetical protein